MSLMLCPNGLNQPTWNTQFAAPAHPEYSPAHSVQSGAMSQALALFFGTSYKFADNFYNAVGFSPRSFSLFADATIETGLSRVYAGIHYRKSCDVSLIQGQIIANNVVRKLKFKK